MKGDAGVDVCIATTTEDLHVIGAQSVPSYVASAITVPIMANLVSKMFKINFMFREGGGLNGFKKTYVKK